MLPRPLTKRLVNHARDDDITEGYAADWTVEQLREPAQRVANRIEALLGSGAPVPEAQPPATRDVAACERSGFFGPVAEIAGPEGRPEKTAACAGTSQRK